MNDTMLSILDQTINAMDKILHPEKYCCDSMTPEEHMATLVASRKAMGIYGMPSIEKDDNDIDLDRLGYAP